MALHVRRTLTLLAAVTALGVAGCRTNPATGRSQLILVSPQEVAAMGAAAAPELVRQYGGEVADGRVRTYVDRVGQAVAARTEPAYAHLDWNFTVLDSDIVNAFALPGGRVFVSRGLIDQFGNEAQLAAVIGHEIGHVTARHIDEQISQSLLVQGLVTGVSASTDSDAVVVGAALFGSGYLLSFSRDQETEADRQGLKYMTAAAYDPAAMLELLQILAAAAEGPRPPEFLSTHPDPRTRIKTVSKLLAGPYRHTQENPDFRKYQRRFERQMGSFLRRPARARQDVSPALGFCTVCRLAPFRASGA